MQVAVVNVAASSGGALTVLDELHRAASKAHQHHWTFVTSADVHTCASNVRVRRFPWVKRSWWHRLWFDLAVLQSELRTIAPDVVVSLENVPIRNLGVRQVVYLQQALPFSGYSVSFRREPRLWLYSQVTQRRIMRGLRVGADFVVQSDWMKDAVIARRPTGRGKVVTIQPSIERPVALQQNASQVALPRRFLYPAASVGYKNHEILINAARLLNSSGRTDFELLLTLSEEEARRLGLGKLPENVVPTGRLARADVLATLACSVLVFPSKVETVGLPLLEARAMGAPIIAADLPYAREALEGYRNATFIDPSDPTAWARQMATTQSSERQTLTSAGIPSDEDSWDQMVRFITEGSL